MATFVLVHGGWGGGWEWRPLAEMLAASGHTVFRPTLTGLGERRHLGTPDTDLDTHIDDVRGVLETEDLDDVVLVGQSYGGAVITGVADRVPGRVGHLVYLDAFVLEDGESVNGVSGEKFAAHFRGLAADKGDGWQVPVWFDAAHVGLPDPVSGWYMSHVGPHPLATLDQPLRLTGAGAEIATSYIDCEPPDAESWVFRPFVERARLRGWTLQHLPVGHDAHVIDPSGLAALLEKIANG
ncbi:MAG TPA: alpha/beta hydrolase family protein [Acidimicrobiia bacterium]|nr:alpha/beta hydrolase family protein [Acidimicrobiia bacterium]